VIAQIEAPLGARQLRVALCDYSGHPFQAQLSRELARRGHDLLHLHFAEFQTPKGRLEREIGDPASFGVEAISLGRSFSKHSLVRRRREEIEVGRRFARRVDGFAPDIVVGCNLPLDSLSEVIRETKAARRRFVFWQQDIYSIAIEKILKKKMGLPGLAIGRHYRHVEKRALEKSDAVIVISPDFRGVLAREFGVDPERVHVVENWAPLDEISPLSKHNEWSRARGFDEMEVVLYSGTLGMKHNPALLLELARALEARDNAILIVTSEGPAAAWLAREGRDCASLLVLPFQPYAIYPQVLASADVAVSILEPEAGVFSVPSKVLSYMCARRPIVLYAPPENLASRMLEGAGAGQAVGDCGELSRRVLALLDNPVARALAGARGRTYAETHFGIRGIAEKFERLFGAFD